LAESSTAQAGAVATSAAATGKRKSAIARVTLKLGTGSFVVNGRTLEDYFPRESLRLERLDGSMRPPLKRSGFLTRDARKKERKKYGQRGARARFQFSKR
jgi:small subunit ribosomal protein S9